MDWLPSTVIVVVSAGIFLFVGAALLRLWPKTGKLGINIDEIHCSQCDEVQPKVRKPANLRQILWGGWTCEKCVTEMDECGARINS